MSTRTIMLAAAASAVTMLGGVGVANAGGGHHGHHNFHHNFHHFKHGPQLYLSLGGCGYEYKKWQYTGSYYWKREYYICRGWW